MSMWPQALVAIFICLTTIYGFVHHGEKRERTIDRGQTLWISLWIALVLGCGGFWNIR